MDFDFQKWWAEFDIKSFLAKADKKKVEGLVAGGIGDFFWSILGFPGQIVKGLMSVMQDKDKAEAERTLTAAKEEAKVIAESIARQLIDGTSRATGIQLAENTPPAAPAGARPSTAAAGRT